MKIAIISAFSCSLGWQKRLQDEGNDVLVLNTEKELRNVSDGIIPLAKNWEEVLSWADKDTLFFFDSSGNGDKAEEVRALGYPIIGGGEFCDRLEKDREFGLDIARSVGVEIPPYQAFESLTEAEELEIEKEVYFKSDEFLESDATKKLEDKEHLIEYFQYIRERFGDNITGILQEKVDGFAISTGRWWNGKKWTGPYECTYERKGFLNDDIGGSTGCSFNAIFFYPIPPYISYALHWEELASKFVENDAPPGLYDINALIDPQGKAWFLEWTPRLGYDSEMSSMRLIDNLTDHLWNISNGKEMPEPSYDLSYAVRLTVPPYPYEHGSPKEEGTADGKPVTQIEGLWGGPFMAMQCRFDKKLGVVVAGNEGIVGVSIATGNDLIALHDEVIEYAKKLHKRGISGLQFRTDGLKCIQEDARIVEKAGNWVHPGIWGPPEEKD